MARTQTSTRRSARPYSYTGRGRATHAPAAPAPAGHSGAWWAGVAVATVAVGAAVYYGYRYLTTPSRVAPGPTAGTTTPTLPSGQAVVPYAGFGRPATAGLSNSVGANPGFGVMIDPNGLNLGLWQQTQGQYHAPLGTGDLAADVGANPVAGQGGGYWAGHPGASF